jgi:hypothetical protein
MGRVDLLEEIARELIMRIEPVLLEKNARPPRISVLMHTDMFEYYIARYAASYENEVLLKFKGSDYKRATPTSLREAFFNQSMAVVCDQEAASKIHVAAAKLSSHHWIEVNFNNKSQTYQSFEIYIPGKVRMQQHNSAQQSALFS